MLIITDKLIIGRREEIDFPQLGLIGIDAKIDTGAYTAALHCHHIKTYRRKGKLFVSFNLLDPTHKQYDNKRINMPVLARRKIKSSSGHTERRVIIKTPVRIQGKKYPLEISLSDRSKMEFPVLLGRKFLSPNFIVDVSHYNLLKKTSRKQHK